MSYGGFINGSSFAVVPAAAPAPASTDDDEDDDDDNDDDVVASPTDADIVVELLTFECLLLPTDDK